MGLGLAWPFLQKKWMKEITALMIDYSRRIQDGWKGVEGRGEEVGKKWCCRVERD